MELPDDDYPFVLTTARSLFHFHTGTMTRKISGLNQLRDREWLEMHASDAERLGLETGEMVKITSRRGSVKVSVQTNTQLIPGVVAMDFHFAESPVNALTNPAHDPISKIPEYKVCAVRIEKLAAGEKTRQTLAI
jgi:anaerobic selenocysteine-containing dehydrogenase